MESTNDKEVGQYFIDYHSKIVGEGKFAIVRQGKDRKNGDAPIAAKIVHNSTVKQHFERLDQELNILQKLKGSHMIKYIGAVRTEHYLYIILEYFEAPNLRNYKTTIVEESLSILKQIASAFLFQEKNLIHRDIKPENILIKDGFVKIVDFGLSKILATEDLKPMDQSMVGTPNYLCPQVLDGDLYGYKCDIWSAGVMIYELLEKKRPWTANTSKDLLKEINTKPLKFSGNLCNKVKNLLAGMLQVNEDARFNWEQVYNHEVMIGIDCPEDDYEKLLKQRKKKEG